MSKKKSKVEEELGILEESPAELKRQAQEYEQHVEKLRKIADEFIIELWTESTGEYPGPQRGPDEDAVLFELIIKSYPLLSGSTKAAVIAFCRHHLNYWGGD